jgi:hypothetical protein
MTDEKTGLAIDVKVDETIALDLPNQRITIRVEAKSGQQARLRVRSEQGVKVTRLSRAKLATLVG